MINATLAPDGSKKGSRIWVDGCFDFCIVSNVSFLLNAKMYGKKLIAGLQNDDEMEQHVGNLVFCEEDRYKLIGSIKWVDEVVEDSPFITTTSILNQFDCDFAVLTENVTRTDEGVDRQEEIRNSTRVKFIQTSELTSENEIAGRILLMKKTHHIDIKTIHNFKNLIEKFSLDSSCQFKSTNVSIFDTVSNKFSKIVDGKAPTSEIKRAYISGSWDVFTAEHLSLMELAKEGSEYLIVGIYTDDEINTEKGMNYPITNLIERVITILSLQIVDEVIIGAPMQVTKQFLDALNINVFGITKWINKNNIQQIFHGKLIELHDDMDSLGEQIIDKIISKRLEYHQLSNNDDTIQICNPSTFSNNQH